MLAVASVRKRTVAGFTQCRSLSSKGSRLVVEGHLSGSAVNELRKSCAARGTETVLDLSGLIFADWSGAVPLKELLADGFVIKGCSGFIRELLLSNAGAKVT